MKKIFSLLTMFISVSVLSSCDDIDPNFITPEIDINASEMVQVLSSGRNNFMPDMEAMEADIKSGDILEVEDYRIYDVYCSPLRDTVDNGDGTFTETYSYYDYDYDYYETAYEMLYNGIDDDDDGEIDEDDEVLLMVTEEMTDGIDNNHNGIIDEYFEMTPSHYVTYTMTYNEGTYTTTTEDGVETTTGSFFYEWTQVRAPYTGQIIETYECYAYDEETGEYTEESSEENNDENTTSNEEENFNDELYVALENLMLESSDAILTLTDEENRELGLLYAELTLGRAFTEEEKEAIYLVWDLYALVDISVTPTEDFATELDYFEFYLERPLTEEEKAAIEIVESISEDQLDVPPTDLLIEFYEVVLERPLTELEIEALVLFYE